MGRVDGIHRLDCDWLLRSTSHLRLTLYYPFRLPVRTETKTGSPSSSKRRKHGGENRASHVAAPLMVPPPHPLGMPYAPTRADALLTATVVEEGDE